MKLPKILTDPPCKGCQKRKEFLAKTARDFKSHFKRSSNAARRLLRAPERSSERRKAPPASGDAALRE